MRNTVGVRVWGRVAFGLGLGADPRGLVGLVQDPQIMKILLKQFHHRNRLILR